MFNYANPPLLPFVLMLVGLGYSTLASAQQITFEPSTTSHDYSIDLSGSAAVVEDTSKNKDGKEVGHTKEIFFPPSDDSSTDEGDCGDADCPPPDPDCVWDECTDDYEEDDSTDEPDDDELDQICAEDDCAVAECTGDECKTEDECEGDECPDEGDNGSGSSGMPNPEADDGSGFTWDDVVRAVKLSGNNTRKAESSLTDVPSVNDLENVVDVNPAQEDGMGLGSAPGFNRFGGNVNPGPVH